MNGTNCCGSQCIDPVGFNSNTDGREEDELSRLNTCVNGDMSLSAPMNPSGGNKWMNSWRMEKRKWKNGWSICTVYIDLFISCLSRRWRWLILGQYDHAVLTSCLNMSRHSGASRSDQLAVMQVRLKIAHKTRLPWILSHHLSQSELKWTKCELDAESSYYYQKTADVPCFSLNSVSLFQDDWGSNDLSSRGKVHSPDDKAHNLETLPPGRKRHAPRCP